MDRIYTMYFSYKRGKFLVGLQDNRKIHQNFPINKLHYKTVCISCNMGRRDMYAQSPRAAGSRDNSIHIRQITTAHVASNMYHFFYAKNLPNLVAPQCSFTLHRNGYSL